MSAAITVSTRLYRWHLECPEFLLTVLARVAEVITLEQVEWLVLESGHPAIESEIDFELYHPDRRPIGSQIDWQLSGCATTALIALRVMADLANLPLAVKERPEQEEA